MGRIERWLGIGVMCVLMALACGTGSRDPVMSRGSVKKGLAPQIGVDLADAYVVPPDWARMAVRIDLSAPTAEEAAAGVRAQHLALSGALAEVSGCRVDVVDYRVPRLERGQYAAAMELRVQVDLTGLAEVADRMERLDGCTGALLERLGAQRDPDTGQAWEITHTDALLGVDSPELHYGALLERAVARLVPAAAGEGAPQLHPEDLRCVPMPGVDVGRRTVSGVELKVKVPCRIPAGRDEYSEAD